MKQLTALLILISVVFSCEKKEKKEDLLFDEVMVIHDEAMIEMSTLRKLAKKLEARVDSLQNMENTVDSIKIVELRNVVLMLREANKGMTDWMYDFKQLSDTVDSEVAISYLTEQKILISKVKKEMFEAKTQGELLLGIK